MKCEIAAGLADQNRVLHPRRDPVHEAGEIAALRFAAGDEHDRRSEAGQRRLDGVKIRSFRVVPESHPIMLEHAREPMTSEPEGARGAIKRGLFETRGAP